MVVRRNIGSGGTSSGAGFAWNRVTVENASKYPKEDVYDALLKAFPQDNHRLKFTPLCFGKQGMNYVFFVELEGVADALSKMSRNVYMYGPDSGQTLSIRVDRSAPPKMNVNDEMWEKAKLVMSSRFDVISQNLLVKTIEAKSYVLSKFNQIVTPNS